MKQPSPPQPTRAELDILRVLWKQGRCTVRQVHEALREQYRAFVAAFREAAARWQRGDFLAPFPLYSFPPRVMLGRVAQIL
jgi:hypothetical protein